MRFFFSNVLKFSGWNPYAHILYLFFVFLFVCLFGVFLFVCFFFHSRSWQCGKVFKKYVLLPRYFFPLPFFPLRLHRQGNQVILFFVFIFAGKYIGDIGLTTDQATFLIYITSYSFTCIGIKSGYVHSLSTINVTLWRLSYKAFIGKKIFKMKKSLVRIILSRITPAPIN